MVIAVNFDGTCVTHEYPDIGKDIGAVPVLKEIQAQGHDIILWTMRSGELLASAVDWFQHYGIKLFGVNCNPLQHTWTSSSKAYAKFYIDDAALGIPLTYSEISKRPYVDWDCIRELLFAKGVL
jgi:hypothetical protein